MGIPLFKQFLYTKLSTAKVSNVRQFKVVLLSDSTGGTVSAAANAVIAQFADMEIETQLLTFVRNVERAKSLLPHIDAADMVIHTIMDPEIVDIITTACDHVGTPVIPLLDHVTSAFIGLEGKQPSNVPGRQYQVDKSYLDQVLAIDYAISHDDGLSAEYLRQADVILVGVSRTSKTPTCIYLAYQGIRAANVPLVPDQNLPPSFGEALAAGVPAVGLIASPTRLTQVRQTRLKALGNPEVEMYAAREDIQKELTSARLFFEKFKMPVIDVTRRSIEETAAAIQTILAEAQT